MTYLSRYYYNLETGEREITQVYVLQRTQREKRKETGLNPFYARSSP